ncbi:MAG: response regulator [Chitinophagaceae bacterium]|nr:MAG: response regulator [Chitinophagaceae bacterium]
MSTSKRKVLIVEDDFILYQELVDFFEQKGYAIIGLPDGAAVDCYEDVVTLLETNEPDIAILDIKIKGKRDGLDIAGYIRERFHTLIVMLTGEDNYENLERAKKINADGFVLKLEKPINLRQLWTTINLKLPDIDRRHIRKTQGEFFKVREIDNTKTTGKNGAAKQVVDPLDLETFIKWEQICFIESYNAKSAGQGNNNVLIHTKDSKAYVSRGSLSEIHDLLPDSFVRFDQSTILNLEHISAKGRGSTLYFIGETPFKLSDRYRDEALKQINDFMGNKF